MTTPLPCAHYAPPALPWTRAELEHALDAVLDEIDLVLERNDFAAAAAIEGQADALTARLARMMSTPVAPIPTTGDAE